MAKSRQERGPIPVHFGTIDEAAEFWDTHDLADYWDLTEEVADVEVDLQQHRYLFALTPNLVVKLSRWPKAKVYLPRPSSTFC